MTRLEGEKQRCVLALQRLREFVDQALLDLEVRGLTPGPDVAQAIAHTAIDVARSLAAIGAYILVGERGPE